MEWKEGREGRLGFSSHVHTREEAAWTFAAIFLHFCSSSLLGHLMETSHHEGGQREAKVGDQLLRNGEKSRI